MIVRAGTLLVRFPGLVDLLLTDPEPPDFKNPSEGSVWRRRDVAQVIANCTAESLARCFCDALEVSAAGVRDSRDHYGAVDQRSSACLDRIGTSW